MSAVIAVVVVVLVGVMLLVGGGEHGPGRHSGGDGDKPAGRHAPPANAPQQPEDHTGPPPGIEH